MARADVIGLIRELEAIDRQLDGDGPHAIVPAVESAVEELKNMKRSRRK